MGNETKRNEWFGQCHSRWFFIISNEFSFSYEIELGFVNDRIEISNLYRLAATQSMVLCVHVRLMSLVTNNHLELFSLLLSSNASPFIDIIHFEVFGNSADNFQSKLLFHILPSMLPWHLWCHLQKRIYALLNYLREFIFKMNISFLTFVSLSLTLCFRLFSSSRAFVWCRDRKPCMWQMTAVIIYFSSMNA